MTLVVRPAIQDDEQALTACLTAAYAPFQELGLPAVTQGIADEIRDHNVWVAQIDGVVRGGIVLVLGPRAHIANLAVHPDAGGHGIGRALIDQACQAAKAAGHAEIQLATHKDMTATQAFYHKLGWQETGREGKKVYLAKQLN
jgi:ribosomal protein S18 acetylase RimI-like enzyme